MILLLNFLINNRIVFSQIFPFFLYELTPNLGYIGTCSIQLFNTWLKQILIPELKPGQVIVLDNAGFHKSKQSLEIIEKAGCKLLFLPPYFPDLNPIETF